MQILILPVDFPLLSQTNLMYCGMADSGRPHQLNDFDLHETVGTGTFGRVRLVQSLLNLEWYVLKVKMVAPRRTDRYYVVIFIGVRM